MTDQENNNSSGSGSSNGLSGNPFAALFGSVADAKQFAAIQKQQQQPRPAAGEGRGGGGGCRGAAEVQPAWEASPRPGGKVSLDLRLWGMNDNRLQSRDEFFHENEMKPANVE